MPETPTLTASQAELLHRKDTIIEGLRQENIDLAIITTPESIYYLTGIELGGFVPQQALMLDSSGSHRFVLRRIEMNWHDLYAPLTWCTDWTSYTDDQHPADVLGGAAKQLRPKLSKIGMELHRRSVSYETVTRVVQQTGAGSVGTVSHLVEKLRVRKSTAELAHMRQAGEITRAGVEAAAATIRGGGTDADGAAAAFAAMVRGGSEFFCDSPYVAVGSKTAMAHAHWANVTPRQGDVVPIYMSASVKRYQCPLERTHTKGAPNARTARMLESVVEATENVMRRLRPGITSHDADRLARNVIEKAGFGEFFVNRLAYSIGIAFPPIWWENDIMQLRPNDERLVETGMTFHLVPALHVPGVGFLNRSMPVVVTETGCEPLSTVPLRVDPL
jgi:Xaa-Pro dipeptidase